MHNTGTVIEDIHVYETWIISHSSLTMSQMSHESFFFFNFFFCLGSNMINSCTSNELAWATILTNHYSANNIGIIEYTFKIGSRKHLMRTTEARLMCWGDLNLAKHLATQDSHSSFIRQLVRFLSHCSCQYSSHM